MTTSPDRVPARRQLGAMTVALRSDLEIEVRRPFDAPRHLVFLAHSKAEYVRQWWGPRGMEVVSCEIDFRPGGRWRIVLRRPGGPEQAFRGEYREIVEPGRLVYTFEWEGAPGAISEETLSFEEVDGRTTIVAVTRFESKGARDAMYNTGMEEGAADTYDRLEAFLRSMP